MVLNKRFEALILARERERKVGRVRFKIVTVISGWICKFCIVFNQYFWLESGFGMLSNKA